MMRAWRWSRTLASLLAFLLLCALVDLALVAEAGAASTGTTPRFVSLRADKVNVRVGPGVRYPIAWVFVRRELPVEVTAEFDLWRKIRDIDGAEGWVHASMLSGRRSAVVTGGVRALRRAPEVASAAVAQVESGVVVKLLRCAGAWCKVAAADIQGWTRRAHLWGVYPEERVR